MCAMEDRLKSVAGSLALVAASALIFGLMFYGGFRALNWMLELAGK
jgi:dolichol kinase